MGKGCSGNNQHHPAIKEKRTRELRVQRQESRSAGEQHIQKDYWCRNTIQVGKGRQGLIAHFMPGVRQALEVGSY